MHTAIPLPGLLLSFAAPFSRPIIFSLSPTGDCPLSISGNSLSRLPLSLSHPHGSVSVDSHPFYAPASGAPGRSVSRHHVPFAATTSSSLTSHHRHGRTTDTNPRGAPKPARRVLSRSSAPLTTGSPSPGRVVYVTLALKARRSYPARFVLSFLAT